MSSQDWKPSTAQAVRTRNAKLDVELLVLFDEAPAARIHEPFGDQWTVAHNLAHIAEFSDYFAPQLREWIDGTRVVMGRVAEHDANRNDAIVRAPDRTLGELREAAEASFARLSETLERLGDEHLHAATQNVKYGEEPLTAYLDRYVIGHKSAHRAQLQEALDALESKGMTPRG